MLHSLPSWLCSTYREQVAGGGVPLFRGNHVWFLKRTLKSDKAQWLKQPYVGFFFTRCLLLCLENEGTLCVSFHPEVVILHGRLTECWRCKALCSASLDVDAVAHLKGYFSLPRGFDAWRNVGKAEVNMLHVMRKRLNIQTCFHWCESRWT